MLIISKNKKVIPFEIDYAVLEGKRDLFLSRITLI